MKRLNPSFLRLLYNKNNTHENFVLNYFKACKFYFYISQLLYFALNRIYIYKRRILLFDSWAILRSVGLLFFFQYFFLNSKILKKSNTFLLKSRFLLLNKKKLYWSYILKCFFLRLSIFISKKYFLEITLLPQNLFLIVLQGKNLHYLTYKKIFFDYNKFCRLFLITNLALFLKNADMLAFTFCQAIRKNKKHHQSINWYTQIVIFLLKYQPKIRGILVKISGRFNNKMQANHRLITLGSSIRLNTLDIIPNYAYRTIITPIGVFGIKVWII
jgi:hypothetical protein